MSGRPFPTTGCAAEDCPRATTCAAYLLHEEREKVTPNKCDGMSRRRHAWPGYEHHTETMERRCVDAGAWQLDHVIPINSIFQAGALAA
jgi:hypothetical protein